jgi:Contact-dependent growth inhibition CdiA C-terminal domain
MSLKINPILPKQQSTTQSKPKITPKVADKTKQTNQAINRLAIRFGGDDETKPPKKTVNDFYQKVLQEQPLNEADRAKKLKISINLSKNAALEDYRLATDKAILQKAGYSMLNKEEVATARDLIGLKDNFNLKNLKDLDKANKLVVTTNQYFVEKAKIAGQAVLQFREYESKELDAAIKHGKSYATDAMGGFVQPIVNAPVNIINGLSEPFRAGEKMLFGTQNIPTIPRMEVAERSEYWNKDNRMLANKGAEIGATIIFGGGAGAKALGTRGGRALLGFESSYNIASGGYGKDVTQPDVNGNPRQMGYAERGTRVFGGVFGARQVVKAEVNTPNSIVNNLDDIFKPKAPQTEAITPEGFRVKVPQTENVKGANVDEMRGRGGYESNEIIDKTGLKMPKVKQPFEVSPSSKPNSLNKPSGEAEKVNLKSASENIRGFKRQNESAETLAKNGYKVEQKPQITDMERASNPWFKKERNPDFKVEGEIFDVFSPAKGTDVNNIRKAIIKKINEGQTRRIVLNLNDNPANLREFKKLILEKPILELEQILVVKDGKVTKFFPFND